jgi:Sulfotransferase domain
MRHNSAVRAVGLPVYRTSRRLRPGRGPRVLANSMPKAGTHLLTSLLDLLPDLRFSGRHITTYDLAGPKDEPADVRRLGRWLAAVATGQYASAHLPAIEGIDQPIHDLGFRHVLIVRDPRDSVVSDLHYITRFAAHPLHPQLMSMATDSDRLTAIITGLPDRRDGQPLLEPMAHRLQSYLPWLRDPQTLCVRFEDLIGPHGGGDVVAQRRAIKSVAEHVGRPLRSADIESVAARVWSPSSSTFRRGSIGDWRDAFTDAHRELVDASAGPQLAALGYE